MVRTPKETPPVQKNLEQRNNFGTTYGFNSWCQFIRETSVSMHVLMYCIYQQARNQGATGQFSPESFKNKFRWAAMDQW